MEKKIEKKMPKTVDLYSTDFKDEKAWKDVLMDLGITWDEDCPQEVTITVSKLEYR